MSKVKGTAAKPPTTGAAPGATDSERLPAYFLSLTVENVRCFGPKQTLDLSDGNGKPAPWTIILGLNGTGKTTLLQALAGCESAPGEVFRTVTDDITTELTITGPKTSGALSAHFREGIRLGTPTAEYSTRLSLSPDLYGEPTGYQSISILLRHGGSETRASKGNGHLWCVAYGAGRVVGSASLTDGEANDPTATLFSDRAELRNPEEWLLQLDYASAKAPKDKDAHHRLAQAKELLLNILPDIEDIRFATNSGPQPRPRAEFKTPDGWVPLRQLGYGYQTLITWVADLANRMAERYPDSANPLHEPAVVLVDEIDLHLHPIWQRKLMSFLRERFPNTQFIATAHSPLVAQAAADANLAVLRREGDHVVIDNEVDNIRNWRIDQILTSDLFGLKTARPPHVEALMDERDKLLEKPRLNAAEKRRLEELNELVENLPFGETAQERKERDVIKQALEVLMKERKPAS